MKKILAVLVLVLFGTVSYAQWATSGNNIYNTNTGNAEAIVKDTDKQEETMLKSFMPNSHQTSPNFSTDRDDMRNDFAFWLHPVSPSSASRGSGSDLGSQRHL